MMKLNQIIFTIKRRSESISKFFFYIAAALCFFFYVGNFNGGFMPVMGTLIAMTLEVALWLLIPILLSIRRRNIAKWAFLGLSIYWALTTIFSLLDGAALANPFASALACATGVFSFFVACAMIVVSVFAVIGYWKRSVKMKQIALAIYCGTLLLFLVLFSLSVALRAEWGAGWNTYFGLLYKYIAIPFAMCFAALAFWFNESDVCFPIFEKNAAVKEDLAEPDYPVISAYESDEMSSQKIVEEERGTSIAEEASVEEGAPVTEEVEEKPLVKEEIAPEPKSMVPEKGKRGRKKKL